MQAATALRNQAATVETGGILPVGNGDGAPANKKAARVVNPDELPHDINVKLVGLLQVWVVIFDCQSCHI